MKVSKKGALVTGWVVMAGFTATVIAGTYNSVQSSYRPLGLSLNDKVQTIGSDSTAVTFNKNLSTYQEYCSSMLPEGVAFTGAGLYQLDPQRLYFLFDYAPRVYFIKDGACYKNALGATIASVSAPTDSVLSGTTFTILPNASSPQGVCGSGVLSRSSSEPLLYGDFVQLPNVKAGQQLAFFLMANLNSSAVPESVYYNGTGNNPDNFQHMIAFFPDNSQYIIIGFEDMYDGGDKDCNDVMFVVDVGSMNAMMWRDASSMPR